MKQKHSSVLTTRWRCWIACLLCTGLLAAFSPTTARAAQVHRLHRIAPTLLAWDIEDTLSGSHTNPLPAWVSDDGSIVAGSSSSTLAPFWGEAYRWTANSGMVALGVFPGAQNAATIPQDMSADGRVIVGGSGASPLEAHAANSAISLVTRQRASAVRSAS